MPKRSRIARLPLVAAATLLLAALPISASPIFAAASTQAATASASAASVAQQTLTLPLPMIWLNQVAMVPARAFFQGVGASFRYQKNVLAAARGDRSVSATAGSPKAVVNGEAAKLDYSPKVVKGTLY